MEREQVHTATSRLVIERGTGSIVLDGWRTRLPVKEFMLIDALAGSPGRAMRAPELIDLIWRDDVGKTEHDVYRLVHRLRRRIGDEGGEKVVDNRRGVGYLLNLPPGEIQVLETI